MRSKFILIFLLCLLILCKKNTSDYEEYISEMPQNPVVMVFKQSREDAVRDKWNDFLEEYNYLKSPGTLLFDSVISYLREVKFNPSYPLIFRFPLTDNNEENISTKMFEFYTQWEDLFGLNPENLKLSYFDYDSETDTMLVSFMQDRINGESWNYVNRPSVSFTINKQGQLLKVCSDLIPDANLKFPTGCNVDKMCENIYGYCVEYACIDGPDSVEHLFYTFDEEDLYFIKSGFEAVLAYSTDTLSVHAAKGIVVASRERVRFLDENIRYLACCNAQTNKMVCIKKIDSIIF